MSGRLIPDPKSESEDPCFFFFFLLTSFAGSKSKSLLEISSHIFFVEVMSVFAKLVSQKLTETRELAKSIIVLPSNAQTNSNF